MIEEGKDPRTHGCILSCIRKLWSFSVVLCAVMLLAVTCTAASVWSVNYSYEMKAVNALANLERSHILSSAVNQVNQTLNNYVQELQLTFDAFRYHDLTSAVLISGTNRIEDDRKTIYATLVSQLLHGSSPFSAMLYGTLDNRTTGVSHANNNTFFSFTSNGDGLLEQRTLFISNFTTDPSVLKIITNYHVTQRALFTGVQASQKTTFSTPFLNLGTRNYYGFTVGTPYFNMSTGKFIGVISGSVDLQVFDQLLTSLKTMKKERIIVLDRTSGDLYGTSNGQTYNYVTVNGTVTPQLTTAKTNPDPLVRESIQMMNKRLLNLSTLSTTSKLQFSYGHGANAKIVQVRRLVNPYGIDLLLLDVQVQSDLLGSVYMANKVNAAICASILFITVLLALLIGCALSIPLHQVSKEMDHVSNLNFDTKNHIHSSVGLYEVSKMTHSLQQMKFGIKGFSKYVPSDIVRVVLSSHNQVNLGVVPCYITVMFVDVRNFTSICESIQADALVQLMNLFFTMMSEIISKHEGVVDKYIGDGIMALFNAPLQVENHEDKAVRCAIEMQNQLETRRNEFEDKGYPLLYIRIGVNSGICLVGNIGCSNRINYTAVGDGVNIASRCESLNKEYNTRIIITGSTYSACQEDILFKWLDFVTLRGKSKPVQVYEVVGFRSESTEEQREMCELHDKLKNEWMKGDVRNFFSVLNDWLKLDPNYTVAQDIRKRYKFNGDVVAASYGG